MGEPLKFQFTQDQLEEALDEVIREDEEVNINDVEKHFGNPKDFISNLDDAIYEMEGDDLREILKQRAKITIKMMLDVAKDDNE